MSAVDKKIQALEKMNPENIEQIVRNSWELNGINWNCLDEYIPLDALKVLQRALIIDLETRQTEG